MKSATQKTLKLALALSLLTAFVCALSLFAAPHSATATLLSPTAEAAPAPVANSARITFKNSRGQEIGEGRPFPLDRVSRGERYAVIVDARSYPVRIVMRAANGYRREDIAYGWYCRYDTVSTNPSFDNVWVTVTDAANGHQLDSRRLPIGSK